MALTKASLATKIKTEIEALMGSAEDPTQLQKFADAVAKAVVDEIQANAVVTVTGVTSGGASAGGTIQ